MVVVKYIIFGSRINNPTGWTRWACAFAYGAMAALSMAPMHWVLFLFPAFWGLYHLLGSSKTAKQAFVDSWLWGLGYFIAGCYWISISLLVEPERFAWMIPFSLIGLNGVFAVFIGGFGVAFFLFKRQHILLNMLLFTLLWCVFELLRGHVLTGFPWNLIGYSLGVSLPLSQIVSVTGTYAAGGLVVLCALSPLLLFQSNRILKGVMIVPVLCITGLWLWGQERLAAYPTEYHDNIELRLVQGNIEQSLKWQPEHAMETLRTYLSLSSGTGDSDSNKTRLIIWPESAFPFLLSSQSEWYDTLAGILNENDLLITGTVTGEKPAPRQLWNSIVAIDHGGQLIARYDKHHLVPFGEFVPLRDVLPLDKITPGQMDFSRGNAPQAITLGEVPAFLPLICYEVIFPSYSIDGRAEWILNLTNDDWFGDSFGPYQHLQMTQFRAIEQGKPVIRVANSGISAVFDPVGRELTRMPLSAQGIKDIALPKMLPKATPYGFYR